MRHKPFLFLLALVFMITLVSSFSANTFSNNLTSENLTFQNYNNVTTTNGTCTNSSGVMNNCANAFDGNFSSFASLTGINAIGAVFVNYTVIAGLNPTLMVESQAINFPNNVLCYNGTGYQSLGNYTGAGAVSNTTFSIPGVCIDSNNNLQLQFTMTNSALGDGTNRIYESSLTYDPNNITRYLIVPAGTLLTNDSFNLTGFNINNSLIKYFKLDEFKGTAVVVDSTNNFNGTNTSNGVNKGAVGILNNSYYFNQTSVALVNISDNVTLGLANITANAWVFVNTSVSDSIIFDRNGLASPSPLSVQPTFSIAIESGEARIAFSNVTDTYFLYSTNPISLNTWHEITAVYNGTYETLYVDGVLNGTRAIIAPLINANINTTIGNRISFGKAFNGLIDEVSLWNRTLTQSEITQLYSSGLALPYNNFTFPVNPSVKINGSTLFSFTGLFNQVNNKTSGFTSTINNYIANCVTVGGFCYVPFTFGSNGGTLQYSALDFGSNGFIENSQTFDTSTLSGSSSIFTLNITYDSTAFTGVSANLVYNGTTYLGSLSGSGDNVLFSRTITIPTVTNSTNTTFYWTISFTNSSGTFNFNSTSHTQLVSPLLLDNCSTFSKIILNMSLYDQDSLTPLNGTIQALVNIYGTDNSTLITTFNKSFNYTGTGALVCISNLSGTYSMNYQLNYIGGNFNSTVYFPQFNNIQNFQLSNATLAQNISLYDLLQSTGTVYQIQVRGTDFGLNDNLVVSVQRQYVSLNQFLLVESPLTDSNGNAIGHLVSNNANYNFVVSQNGTVIGTFNNFQVTCPQFTTTTCTISLILAQSTGGQTDFQNFGNISAIYLFDQTNRILYLTYQSTDGNVHNVTMQVIKNDGYANNTICSVTGIGTSGTLICNIPASYGNISFMANLYSDSVFLGTNFLSFAPSSQSTFYGARTIIGVFLYTTLVMLFIANPWMIVIASILGIVFAGLFLLIDGGTFLGVSSIVIWFIIAGAIILYKMTRRS